jgi:hypothetical protein
VGESVELFEHLDPAVGAQLGEQAATADGLQLAMVTNQDETPAVCLGETHELMQGWGGQHPGLVDYYGRPGAESVLGSRWPVGPLPFMEQFGDGVGAHAGVPFEYPGRLRCRCHTEHRTTIDVQISNSGGEHPGLAGTGGTDDQHKAIVAGDRASRFGLQHIQTGALHGPRRRNGSGLSIDRPAENPFLLDEHRLRGEPRCRWLDPQRATIRVSTLHRVRRIQVDAALQHLVGATLDRRCPTLSGHLRHGTVQVTDRLNHVGPTPRRVLRRHRFDDVGDRWRVRRGTVGGGPPDVLDEPFDGPADSPCQRVARSATPSPDLRPRVSAED